MRWNVIMIVDTDEAQGANWCGVYICGHWPEKLENKKN